jgi:ribulose-phosphate 3-epimerase
MHQIIPAILGKNDGEISAQIQKIPAEITFLHVDVLPEDAWAEFPQDFEVHLMLPDPETHVEKWVKRGAKRIILHSLGGRTAKFDHECEIGLGVELHVPLGEVYPFLDYVDFVHLMSIAEIGEQGHPLDEKIFDRVKEIQERYPELPISVDGGVNLSNYQRLLDAGADRLVVGSGFEELWTALKTT